MQVLNLAVNHYCEMPHATSTDVTSWSTLEWDSTAATGADLKAKVGLFHWDVSCIHEICALFVEEDPACSILATEGVSGTAIGIDWSKKMKEDGFYQISFSRADEGLVDNAVTFYDEYTPYNTDLVCFYYYAPATTNYLLLKSKNLCYYTTALTFADMDGDLTGDDCVPCYTSTCTSSYQLDDTTYLYHSLTDACPTDVYGLKLFVYN